MLISFNVRILCCALLILLGFESFSQQIPPRNLKIINKILEKKYTTYDTLNKYTAPFKRDSISLKHFIKESEAASYLIGQAFGENTLGVYLRDISQYRQSLEHHQKALTLVEQIDNIELKVSVLNMTGVVYRRIDAVRSALDKHYSALSLAESQNEKSPSIIKSIAISLNSIGNIYLTLKDYAAAESYFKRAIIYEKTIKSDLGLAINYGNIGIVYEELENYEEALMNYRKSLEYNDKLKSDLGRVICYNSIGQVFLKQGKTEEALALIEGTIAKTYKLGDQFYIAFANINMGWANKELGNYAISEKYLMEAISIAKRNNLKQFLSMAYMHTSKLKETTSNYQEALEYQRLYQKVQDEYLNEANHKYVSDLIMKYDSEQKKNTISILEQKNKLSQIKLEQSRKNNFLTILVFLLTLFILFISYRQYRLKNQKRNLKAEQTLMRSQMNPHFIFNALLSIRIYLQNNNVADAMDYLNQFAKLIRSILSSSLEKEITLEEELEMMQLYVNIENIRFCNEIEYTVNVEKGLDLSSIQIPSLILQPFVENALWHGLQAKEGLKKLCIDVSKKEAGFVAISITDNGIGREKTMNLPSDKRNTQKKSIGIDLTLRRLQNFAKNLKKTYNLQILDLYNDQKESSGTRIELDLPVR